MSQYTRYPVISGGGGGSGITSLTGGVTATGPGAAVATVVTNANLTGDVTSVGNATTLTNAPVIAKVLTGYAKGAGTVSSTDSILTAIQKLDGNDPGVSATAKVVYVSQDTGNDSNLGTLYSPLKTIQAGINKAELIAAYYNQVIVMISPSSTGNGYQEDLTMSQQGVSLQAVSSRYRSDSVVIKGNLTINLSGTSGGANYVAASNIVYVRGCIFSCATGNTLTFSGTAFQRLFLTDSYLDNTGTGSTIVLTNTGSSGGTKSTITVKDTDISNSNATNPAIRVSAGRIFTSGTTYDISNGNASGPSIIVDGASATATTSIFTQCTITGQIQVTDNLSNVTLNLATVGSGAAAAIATPATPNTGLITLSFTALNTTATNSITGAGVVALLGVYKLNTGGDIISTVTQATVNTFPQGATLLGATSTQTTNAMLTIKNGHVKSQQTTAPTVAAANSGTSPTATLSNATDTAGRINYTTGSGAITTSATCTITFNKAHATAPIVVLTPQSAIAGSNAVQVYVTATTTTAVLNFGVAPIASTAYNWFYQVIETQ